MPELGVFEKILGYKFKNIAYLQNALTHTSYINEHKNNPGGSNERMEFLGDSVLGLSVSDYLYRNYKNLPEGVLSKIRASVVCEDSLAKLASTLKLGEFLYMGKGELLSGGSFKPSVTSDAMESVIAAIYLDAGFETAKSYVLSWLEESIIEAVEHKGKETDYKSRLQEFCQSKGFVPTYTLLGESGPDHSKTFESRVSIEDGRFADGTGSNKKKAQQMAAKAMLNILKIKS
ncbi:MAG: ribonuclease III [Ruminococcaceae bacterium]|nr:ribonuclease III [Oscillospiraceae bacterium]